MDPLDRLLAAAPRLPAPWLAHAQAYRAERVGLTLILHELGRYLHDVARSGDRAELGACLRAIEDVLAGDDAVLKAELVDQVLGSVVHMPGFPFDWPLGPRTQAQLDARSG
jgi:hypothetical protein